MPHLDNDYVEQLLHRLRSIPDDGTPKWGTLRKDTLIEHLVWVVRHSMGRSKQVRFMGNWLTVNIIGPLFVRGLFPDVRNLRFKNSDKLLREPGDLETLHALLEEYLGLVQAGELEPGPHPLFGNIGVDGWDRVHVRHFEHHCKQFGV